MRYLNEGFVLLGVHDEVDEAGWQLADDRFVECLGRVRLNVRTGRGDGFTSSL